MYQINVYTDKMHVPNKMHVHLMSGLGFRRIQVGEGIEIRQIGQEVEN